MERIKLFRAGVIVVAMMGAGNVNLAGQNKNRFGHWERREGTSR